MGEIKQALVVGLGAIGSIYATKLQQYDAGCVRALVDAERLARYRANGIVLNGERLDFNYVLPEQNASKADLILIATKADALPDAIAGIAGFVHDETTILALLNGITSEGMIAERYGWNKVLHSYFVGHGSTRVGSAVTFDGVGRIVFGETEKQGRTPRVEKVVRFFVQAGIGYEVPDDILFSQWCKFVLNVGINMSSAVLRAPYGAYQRDGEARAIAFDLMREAVLIAEKEGIHNTEALLPWGENFIRNAPPAFRSSTLQDIEAGKKTEVAIFGGAVCALGEKHGIPTPLNATFVQLIRALEEMQE